LGAENGKMVADLRDKGFEVQSGDTGIIAIIPDSKNPESPFSKKAVREAISLAIDREAIVKARGFGYWEPIQQLPLRGHLGYSQEFNRPYDPEKAKILLKEAGYSDGFETKLVPSPFGVDMNIFVAIQAYLGAIGVKAKIEKVPYSKYSDYRFKGWHNGLLAQPFGVEVNIIRSYDNYLSQPAKMMQFPVLERPDGFQELLDEAASTIEPDKGLMNQLGKLIFDEVTVIPIHTTGRSFIHRKNVHDTGHMKWARWTQWNADTAWKSK
jgi:peptide/nickel transport system substrate-binding protein